MRTRRFDDMKLSTWISNSYQIAVTNHKCDTQHLLHSQTPAELTPSRDLLKSLPQYSHLTNLFASITAEMLFGRFEIINVLMNLKC